MVKNEILKQIGPCNTDEPFVFISYSSLDSQRVWEDVLHFQQLGYNVWLDERNLDKRKHSWRADALEAIRDINCSLLVFYVSRHSLVSQACFAELESTVEELTQSTHNGPVEFIAVDAEPIDDIIQFQQQVYAQVRSSQELSKDEKTGRLVTLHKCIDQFFDRNNEKVRVKALGIPNRKMDYYEEITAAFPAECRCFPQISKTEPKRPPIPVANPAQQFQPKQILEMPYDFLEYIRLKFEGDSSEQKNLDENIPSPRIPLANARRIREPYSFSFSISDAPEVTSRAFCLDEYLVPQDGKWILMLRLRQIPYLSISDNGADELEFQVEGEHFADDPEHQGLILTVQKETGDAFFYVFYINGEDLYVSREPTYVGTQELDESGYDTDSDLEMLLAFCNIEGSATHDFRQPVCWRRSVSQYRPEYLGYLILNTQTMEEIPKTLGRGANGTYELSMVLPCPCSLCILQVTPDEDGYADASNAVAGYLHGIYGLKKNPAAAERLMRKKAQDGDPSMAFEYGAFLRQEGKLKQAEMYLRTAAANGSYGAKFELAELLLEKANQDNTANTEILQLVDELWAQGYRTYGPDKSIDLLGTHRQYE